MRKYQPLRDCPICTSTSGKCRSTQDGDKEFILCMGLPDEKFGSVINSWKCIRSDSGVHSWAGSTWVEDNTAEWSEERRKEWEEQRRQRQEQQAREEEERRRLSLSAEERNSGYTAILTELELHPEDRADLERRGFSPEEIERSGFRSVSRYQRLKSPADPRLPGVSADGKFLTVGGDGYLCPIRDVDGLIVACQIRLRNPSDGNRYRWLSSKNAVLALPNGELPLAVFRPVDKPKGISLAEGTGAKPFLVAQRRDEICIGSSGGQWCASPTTLKGTLEKLASEIESRVITIYPDAGDTLNSSVILRWKRTIQLLKELGWRVDVAWWGQVDKDQCDADELTDFGQIQLIAAENFSWEVGAVEGGKGGDREISQPDKTDTEQELKQFEKALREENSKRPKLGFSTLSSVNIAAGDLEFEEEIKRVQRKLRSLSYKADIEISERYLPNDLAGRLPKSGIILLVGHKGCGKSVTLKKVIALAKKQGSPVLSITPRIALGREQAFKWEITWIDDYGMVKTQAGDTAEQINDLVKRREKAKGRLGELGQIQVDFLQPDQLEKMEEERQNLEAEIDALNQEIDNVKNSSIYTLGLCWDSLWRTKDRDMKDSLIVIDEAELGFTHLATSSTCRSNRPHLLQVFSEKITECLMSGGRVILSDADLTDVSVDYVRQLLPIPLKPYVVLNNYKNTESPPIVDFRSGSRGSTLEAFMEAIALGKIPALTTDSQAEAEALERKILQRFPQFCTFIDSESGQITEEAKAGKPYGIRIDSKITETEAGKEFLSKPNESILKHQPRYLIYTPSMGVGVSIDESTTKTQFKVTVPYFDLVFGLFFGTIEPSQCRQQLARVRANIKRIVWCKEFNRALDGCKSFFPNEISKQLFQYHQMNLNPIDIARAAAGSDADDEEVMEKLIQLYKQSWDKKEKCWRNPHLELYAKLKARRNYGLWNLAALLREELEDEGYKVVSLEGDSSQLTEDLKGIKEDIKREEAVKISEAAPLPTVEDARKVLNSINSTQEQRYSARKTLMMDELPGVELTQEFVFGSYLKDRGKQLNSWKLFWYLHNGEALKVTDTDRLVGQFKRFTDGIAYMPDVRALTPKVEAIRQCGLMEWLNLEEPSKTYSADSSEAQQFLQKALKVKELLKTTLDVTVTKDSKVIQLVNKIAEKVGLKLVKEREKSSNRQYILDPNILSNTDRQAVLEALTRRWEEQTAKIAEIATQQHIQPVQHLPIVLNTPASVALEKESQGDGEVTVYQNLSTEREELEAKGTEDVELSQLATRLRGFAGEDGAVACEVRFWEVAAPYLATPGDREVFEDAIYEIGLNRGWRLLKLWQDGWQQQAATEGLQPIADTLQPILEPTVLQGFELAYAVKRGKEILGHIGKRSGTKALWWAVGLAGRLFPTEYDAAAALAMA